MGKRNCVALLGLRLLSNLVSADETDDGILAKCNDDNTLSVTINYYASSAMQILDATYGTCALGDAGISGTAGLSSSGWNVTLEPSRCNMESKLRTLDYNQTAEFVVGKKDGDNKLVTARFEIDTYCSYTSEYTVAYGYNVVGDSHSFTDSGGLLGIAFVIDSFKSDFSGKEAPSQQAGTMIYLGLYINETATPDFDYAASDSASTGKIFVPTMCRVNDGNYTYTLFDTVDVAKCSNDFIGLDIAKLVVNESGKHMWKISHLLFLLKDSQGIPSAPVTYSLSCTITVCDMADASKCKAAAACLAGGDDSMLSMVNDTMLRKDNGNFLGSLSQDGSLEDLKNAVNLIQSAGLNVLDYLEIETSVSGVSQITPLLRACLDLSAEGPAKVAFLASVGANTAHTALYGTNILHYAAQYGSAVVVQFILDQGWVSNSSTVSNSSVEVYGSDALLLAGLDNDTPDQLAKLKMLTATNPTANARPDGYSLWHAVAMTGSLETVRYVLDTFPKRVFYADDDRTAPFLAAFNDPDIADDVLTMFFDDKWNLNLTLSTSYNIFHYFCRYTKSAPAIELLVAMIERNELPFNLNDQNDWGGTGLSYLEDYNQKFSVSERRTVLAFLVGKGATRTFSSGNEEGSDATPTP